MMRLLFPAVAVAASIVVVAACDPDLTPKVVPGGGREGGPVVSPDAQPENDGGDAEGGPSEGGIEAGLAHVIDGINDFAAGEKFATTSALYDAYVSWDDTNVYFGMSGPDVGTNSSTRWVMIYVDGNSGNAGSAVGIGYDCSGACAQQRANLAFNAGYHLRWKADGSYTNLQKWDVSGSVPAWVSVGPISTVDHQGTFMELSITRAALGKPTTLKVHMNMLNEQAGGEWTFAGAPSTSFTDGTNPATFAKYYDFDLADRAKAPNTYAPKPP